VGILGAVIAVAHALSQQGNTTMMRQLVNMMREPSFWDKKVRIALLTLATFAALC
jgi:hypothetical protein